MRTNTDKAVESIFMLLFMLLLPWLLLEESKSYIDYFLIVLVVECMAEIVIQKAIDIYKEKVKDEKKSDDIL